MKAFDAPTGSGETVCVLLGVHNGARFLAEQLDSIARQDSVDWQLLASDDGSTDASAGILRDFGQKHGAARVKIIDGPRQGLVANYRALLAAAPQAGALAWCDQDDIWLPGKLTRALTALQRVPKSVPAAYASTVIHSDQAGRTQGRSRMPRRPLSFRNAIVQNVLPGNTLVLNPAAARLMQTAEARLAGAGSAYALHDWWTYLLITACGGTIIFDPEPGVLYRQHDGNAIGANAGLSASLARMRGVWAGRNAQWLSQHMAALGVLGDLLTEDARMVLGQIAQARKAPLARRIAGMAKTGIHVQTRRATWDSGWQFWPGGCDGALAMAEMCHRTGMARPNHPRVKHTTGRRASLDAFPALG